MERRGRENRRNCSRKIRDPGELRRISADRGHWSTSDEDAAAGERSGGLDVSEPIAHPPALGQIDPESCSGLLIEQGTRLSAPAGTVDLRQMGAMKVRVERRAVFGEEFVQPALRREILLLADETAGNPRLIGRNYGQEAGLVEASHGDPCAWQETDLRRITHIRNILDERPISVEEYGTQAAHSISAWVSACPTITNDSSSSVRGSRRTRPP